MVNTKKDLEKYLLFEKKKYFPNSKKYIKSFIFGNASEKNIIWKYQKRLRKLEYHLNNNHSIRKILYKYLLQKIGNKYGLHIPPNVFGIGLKIMHLGPILVNKNSKIGNNCSIHTNTSIVAHGIEDSAPTIGDNCVIGAGAVVNKNFKNNVTIAGVPASIISTNTSKNWRKE